MRIYTLIAACLLLSFAGLRAQCTQTAPYSESFDGTATPTCWTESGSDTWKYSTAADYGADSASDHTGNGGNYAWIDGSGSSGPTIATTLETPLVDISGLTTPTLTYWVFSNNTNNPGDNNTLIIDFFDGTTWNNVDTFRQDSADWVEFQVDLSTYTITGNVQARFIVVEDAGTAYYNDILLDDISFANLPTCLTAGNMTASNITTSSVDLAWTDNNTVTAGSYIVEYGPTGFTRGAGTMVSATTSPFNLTGLMAATDYDVYIRPFCGVGDTAAYTAPLNLTTACSIFSAPYLETFDGSTTPNCWTESGSEAWKYSTAAGYGAGNAGDHTGNGGNYAWIDGSSPNGATQISTLETPQVDVTALTRPGLIFWVYSNNVDDPGVNNTLIIDIYDGANWTTVDTIRQDFPNWHEVMVDLSLFTITGPVQARFTVVEDAASNPFENDILIDDVAFDDLPSCVPVSGLTASNVTATSADLNWTAAATNFQVEVVMTGNTPTGTTAVINTNSSSQTGLMDNTTYDVYVRAVCAPGDTSAWTMTSFTTPCAVNGDTPTDPIVVTTATFNDTSSTASCYTDFMGYTSADVWYQVVITDPCVTTIDASLCGSSYDTYLRIYDANLVEIASNDDASCGRQSEILGTAVTYQDTFYVMVEGFLSNTGAYVLAITQNSVTPVADISYPFASYCQNSGQIAVTNNGDLGGIYMSTAGLDIDSLTGEISAGSSSIAAYSVIYGVGPNMSCMDYDTVAVAIADADTADISYPMTTYCFGAGTVTPTVFATQGGSFSSPSNVLDLDPTTGAINVDNSNAGLHAIVYTTPNACADLDTFVINIDAADTADISYPMSSYCLDGTNPIAQINASNNGLFTSTPGIVLESFGGTIDLANSQAGAYVISYTTQGSCPDVDTVIITLNGRDDASFVYDTTTFCLGTQVTTLPTTMVSGGTFSSSTGLVLDPNTGTIDFDNSPINANHSVTYTTAGACSDNATINISIIDCSTSITAWNEQTIKLFPNPNNGQFQLQLEQALEGAQQIRIFNTLGQVVWTQTASIQQQYDFNLSNLPAGQYILQLEGKDGRLQLPFVLAK